MIAVIRAEAGLPWLVAAAFGAQSLASLFNTILYFSRTRPDLRPRRSSVSTGTIRQIASTGVLFLILQVVVAVAYASDNLVIAQILGASAVPAYAVPEKLFSFVALALATVLTPLWPAYGEALARGDVAWVRRTFARSLALSGGMAAGLAMALVLAAPGLLSLWVGRSIAPPLLLLVGLAVWKTIEAGGNAMAMLLNGANVVRVQIVVAVGAGICALLLKIVLVGHIGVAGAVWATIIAYSVIAVVPLAMWAVPRALSPLARANCVVPSHGASTP
jgi:O-antigen/teichoic acid export membrane protein